MWITSVTESLKQAFAEIRVAPLGDPFGARIEETDENALHAEDAPPQNQDSNDRFLHAHPTRRLCCTLRMSRKRGVADGAKAAKEEVRRLLTPSRPVFFPSSR